VSEQLYPLRLVGRPVARVWGEQDTTGLLGRNIVKDEPIGEVWTAGDWEAGDRVLDGPLAGRTVAELLHELGDAPLLGAARRTPAGRFPLLVKWIGSAKDLSIQVHPDAEASARIGEGAEPKTECWYILGAEPGAEIIFGLKVGATADAVADGALDGSLEPMMNRIQVKRGDAVFVPSGMVHAICAGVRLLEVQENSDTTYRLYDYNRPGLDGKPRQLHVEQAHGSIKTGRELPALGPSLAIRDGDCERRLRVACKRFWTEEIEIRGSAAVAVPGHSFLFFSVLDGAGAVSANGQTVPLGRADSALLPASLGCAEVHAPEGLTVLACGVPDLEKDIIAPLRAAGHADAEIAGLGGNLFGNDLLELLT